MKNFSHHNWFLVVLEKNIVQLAWLSLIVAFACIAATFIFGKIYSASAELTLDASADHLATGLTGGFPTTKSSDFIRQEYFAINAVNMMQQPSLAESVIRKFGLVDRSGKKLQAHNFINPSFLALLFTNKAQGVTVEWISDTQQFSITGYGKDVEAAALVASRYCEAFLAFERQQFVQLLENLKVRKQVMQEAALDRRAMVDEELGTLRTEYNVADWSGRLESMTSSLASLEHTIEDEELAAAVLAQQLLEYERQITELAQPIHRSEVEQKSHMITSLQISLASLAQQLAAAAANFTPEHPEYKKIQRQIDELQRRMVTEAKKEYAQTSRSTSNTLDSVLTNLMTARVNKAIRAGRLEKLHATKEQYLHEMGRVAKGSALYSNLDDEKKSLTTTIQRERGDILSLDSLMAKPFSFYRVSATPFIDKEYPENSRYFPKRKLILLLSLVSTVFLAFFYILFKELHIETLYYAWQCTALPADVTPIDVTLGDQQGMRTLARYVAAQHTKESLLVRIRQHDAGPATQQVASAVASYLVRSGVKTLLLDESRHPGTDQEGATGKGLRSWLSGQENDLAGCIVTHENGYDILYCSNDGPDTQCVCETQERQQMFASLLGRYQAVLQVDRSLLGATACLPIDVVAAHVDVFVVSSGAMAVDQEVKVIELEKQLYATDRAVLVVVNDGRQVDVFSLSGLASLARRFVSLPVELVGKWLR